jgi:hypothetical protein
MSQETYLQQILGTDKRNPVFTIYRKKETNSLHVYFGGELLETIPDDHEDPQYKIMLARLYNAGVNATKLQSTFGTDCKTMRRWGDALKCGDNETLIRVLLGRQAKRKLTPEIQGFANTRFPRIYENNRSTYSKEMRSEIYEAFNVELCSETLRPLLKKLKDEINGDDFERNENRETSCECTGNDEIHDSANDKLSRSVIDEEGNEVSSCIRNESPVLEESPDIKIRFVHHLGVTIFSSILQKVEAVNNTAGWLIKQWLATLFLGTVNIEQSKLLDFESLNAVLGRTLFSRCPQRKYLEALACTQTADELLIANYKQVNAGDYSDFYYDPHTKHCTTKDLRLLKSWCGGKHMVAKVLEMDFIHTSNGHPVHIGYGDSYTDLRERFIGTINDFRSLHNIDEERILSVTVDRGIFGKDTFRKIIEDTHLTVITWEKNYQKGKWCEDKVKGAFAMERCRNKAEDVKMYKFEYMDESWGKDDDMRLLRIRATNPKGRMIELGILTNDKTRAAEEIIRLMFRRWIQENDFKYLEKHFGINQITSYASVPYDKIKNNVEDKQVKSGKCKALEKQRKQLRKKIKQLLFTEHQHPGKNISRKGKIKQLSLEDENISRQIDESKQEVSKLELLIKQEYRCLDTAQKEIMDALKLIARNSFYQTLQPFKKKYNNYRDDHVLFRNLTHANGIMISSRHMVEIQLFPTAHYTPALQNIINDILNKLNQQNLRLPDGSGRRILFCLGNKAGIELANVNPVFNHYT